MVRKKDNGIWLLGSMLLILVGCLLFWGATNSVQSQEESTCISCHTSVKDLVKITREIAAKRPPQKKSTESTGEG